MQERPPRKKEGQDVKRSCPFHAAFSSLRQQPFAGIDQANSHFLAFV